MRHLTLFLFLLLSSFVSAQCFISVSFLESECTETGDAFFVNFVVEGSSSNSWISPTLNISGLYNTGDVFRAGPFPNDAFETILFQDSVNTACFNVYDTPLPDCPDPGCENFVITASADDATFCESGEIWSFNQTGGQFPISFRLTNEFGELVRQQFFDTPDGISIFIDEGAYSVVMTDEAGCTASTVIEVAAHFCASIGGFNWFDRNADGRQDADEVGLEGFRFDLLDINFNSIATTTSDGDGTFLFNNILPGTYYVSVVAEDGFELSNRNVGDDCADSDFNPTTLTSVALELLEGETMTCIDAGWYQEVSIFGFSWRDDNGDGIQSSSERGVVPAAVTLLIDETVIALTSTNANGTYSFDGIMPGFEYAVRFSPETTRVAVEQFAGDNRCDNSAINPATFTTDYLYIDRNTRCINAGWDLLPCEDFHVSINPNDDFPPCWPESEIYIVASNNDHFPLYVEFLDTLTQEVILDTITNTNGVSYPDLPSAILQVTVTGSNDCSVTEFVDNIRGEGCGNFSGVSWRDENENGLRDEFEPIFTTVELLHDGSVIQETRTTSNGFYGFWDLPLGDYQIRFASPAGFMPTIKDANGDVFFNDSAVDPVTNLTDILTVPPGGRQDTINVGWVRTFECSEFQLNVELEVGDQQCTSLGEYIASVPVASYPLEFFLINPFNRDTLESITLTEPGEARFDISVPTTYVIAVLDASGCGDEYNFRALRSERVTGDIRQTGTSCIADSIPTLTFLTSLNDQDISYEWSTGETGPSITNLIIGVTYSVTVTSEMTNCSNVWRRTVTSTLPPGLEVVSFDEPFLLGCGQDSVLIEPEVVLAGFTYQWFGPQNFFSEGPAFVTTIEGVYTLEALNESGCLIVGRAIVENASLDGQFIELFQWQDDSVCAEVICFGLETSVPLGENSNFGILWEGPNEDFNDLANNSPFNSFCGVVPGLYRVTITSECDTVRRSLFIEEQPECNSISGTLWVDQAADCDLDPEDTRVPRYVVMLTNQDDGEVYYAMTNMAGNWSANVPLGSYVIEPSLDPMSPFGTCPPVNVTLGDSPITGIQLFLPGEIACAQCAVASPTRLLCNTKTGVRLRP